MLETSPDNLPDTRQRDERLRVRLDARTIGSLRNECIARSAKAGRPIYPHHLAAMILGEWSKARAETKARERAERMATSSDAEDCDPDEGV